MLKVEKTKKKTHLLVRKRKYKIAILDGEKMARKAIKRKENNSTISKVFEENKHRKKRKSKRKKIKMGAKKWSHR